MNDIEDWMSFYEDIEMGLTEINKASKDDDDYEIGQLEQYIRDYNSDSTTLDKTMSKFEEIKNDIPKIEKDVDEMLYSFEDDMQSSEFWSTFI